MFYLMKLIIEFLSRLGGKVYRLYMGQQLASFGKGASLKFPATLYNPHLISVGRGTVIREHAWLNAGRADGVDVVLNIGSGCYIGRFAHVNAKKNVTIEDDVLIADRVYISDIDHDFSDPNTAVIRQGLFSRGPVTLKSGCWIGAGAVILSGVTVGRNAVVGANAVVNRDVPDYAVVSGNPAQVVKQRQP